MYSINPEEHLKTKGIIDLNKSSIEIKETEPKINLELEKIKESHKFEERQWKSCCFQLEKESSLFFAKVLISMSVISLCAFQLFNLKDCSYQSLYSSILSSVVTFWLNSKNK